MGPLSLSEKMKRALDLKILLKLSEFDRFCPVDILFNKPAYGVVDGRVYELNFYGYIKVDKGDGTFEQGEPIYEVITDNPAAFERPSKVRERHAGGLNQVFQPGCAS